MKATVTLRFKLGEIEADAGSGRNFLEFLGSSKTMNIWKAQFVRHRYENEDTLHGPSLSLRQLTPRLNIGNDQSKSCM